MANVSAQDRLQGVGGLAIFWQAWLPAGDPRAVVLIAHGAGEHSGRYGSLAARLRRDGYAVYALDHRGHGRSEGPRALIDRMGHAVADLHTLAGLAHARHRSAACFLFGHSMGGTVALRYAIAHGAELRGLILSGPLAAVEDAPAALRALVPVLSVLAPRMPLLAVDPQLVSRDPAVVQAYRSDPLVHHSKLPARTVAELATTVASLPNTVGSIKTPTLIAYGTADRLCPPAGSLMLKERIGAADTTLRGYEGLAHEILNEPEQARVMDEICAWIAERVSSAA
ncbi:MAG: lysophospholipase [Actinomycetota bacterium]|nr:lysophospholipase [Actinomycetota bacterium]